MSGGAKAGALIALAIVVLVCLNIGFYRRFRAALAEGHRREGVSAASDEPASPGL
ncbi:hypothetical protein Q5H91_05055 [Sphingomonas sp. KR1UV-12]|uniref:Uncharacterized protein n=1 Tax=Sphingomonas aurea TaxID=3063994 RepID=A0ABT9EI98_9SPHN|nr:hypothetical protein [Sphingomonas sp. KR1UV-12]MDP1026570.1 hypothetical protein [Sphingomonas sp. KR1UV-12]